MVDRATPHHLYDISWFRRGVLTRTLGHPPSNMATLYVDQTTSTEVTTAAFELFDIDDEKRRGSFLHRCLQFQILGFYQVVPSKHPLKEPYDLWPGHDPPSNMATLYVDQTTSTEVTTAAFELFDIDDETMFDGGSCNPTSPVWYFLISARSLDSYSWALVWMKRSHPRHPIAQRDVLLRTGGLHLHCATTWAGIEQIQTFHFQRWNGLDRPGWMTAYDPLDRCGRFVLAQSW
jgi:hypothetical protein